jgi:hypothetical protein
VNKHDLPACVCVTECLLLLQVVNVSPDLPARFRVEKMGPYFSCDVTEGEIQAGQSRLIRVRYQPKVPSLPRIIPNTIACAMHMRMPLIGYCHW